MTITIKAARDAEAGVWYIANSDPPGLNLEGESLDELYDKLFHGIEEITGEPKVEFELVILGRRWPGFGLSHSPWIARAKRIDALIRGRDRTCVASFVRTKLTMPLF